MRIRQTPKAAAPPAIIGGSCGHLSRAAMAMHDLRRVHGSLSGLYRTDAEDRGHAPIPGDGSKRNFPNPCRRRSPRLKSAAIHSAAPRLRAWTGRMGSTCLSSGIAKRPKSCSGWAAAAPWWNATRRSCAPPRKLLHAAGVKFAILGREEKCCGDPARRMGNEFLFENIGQRKHRHSEASTRSRRSSLPARIASIR